MTKPLCDTHEALWGSLVADNMIPLYDDIDLALSLSYKIQEHTVSIAKHEWLLGELEQLKEAADFSDANKNAEIERLKKELAGIKQYVESCSEDGCLHCKECGESLCDTAHLICGKKVERLKKELEGYRVAEKVVIKLVYEDFDKDLTDLKVTNNLLIAEGERRTMEKVKVAFAKHEVCSYYKCRVYGDNYESQSPECILKELGLNKEGVE